MTALVITAMITTTPDLLARCHLVNEVAHGTHIDDKDPQSPWNVPAAEVGLSSHNEPTLALVLYPLVPFPIRSLFFFPSPLLPLSDVQRRTASPPAPVPVLPAAQQGSLVQPLHRPRLWYAIASSLVLLFHTCLIIHLSRHLGTFLAVYLISMRILLCVRVLSMSN
jgi:hypothetical protein